MEDKNIDPQEEVIKSGYDPNDPLNYQGDKDIIILKDKDGSRYVSTTEEAINSNVALRANLLAAINETNFYNISPVSGEYPGGIFNVTKATDNTNRTDKTGSVTVSATGATEKVVSITQKGQIIFQNVPNVIVTPAPANGGIGIPDSHLKLNVEKFTIKCLATFVSKIEFSRDNGTTWTTITLNPDTHTYTGTRQYVALEDFFFRLTLLANPHAESRSITLAAWSGASTIQPTFGVVNMVVIQTAAAPTLTLSTNEITLGAAAGSSATIVINTNVKEGWKVKQ